MIICNRFFDLCLILTDCRFEDVAGFLRNTCRNKENNTASYQCPGSDNLYKVLDRYATKQKLSMKCPKDKYNYQACHGPIFNPLELGGKTVFVCGVVCDYKFNLNPFRPSQKKVESGRPVETLKFCNDRIDCKDGVDEDYCTERNGMDSVASGARTSTSPNRKCVIRNATAIGVRTNGIAENLVINTRVITLKIG